MKNMLHYGFILALICTVASSLLAGVNSLTKPKIIAQAELEEQNSLTEVLAEGKKFEAVKSGEKVIYYKAYNQEGKLIGFAFEAQGKGYSSLIETMVGMKIDGTIAAIKVLSQSETPGLGARVASLEFTARLSKINSRDLSTVQAITGATISSRAVIDSVQKKAEEIKELIKNEK